MLGVLVLHNWDGKVTVRLTFSICGEGDRVGQTVQESRESIEIQKNYTIYIPHSDSLGPAGIMCALCYCVERLNNERMVDIFQAVQSIQLQRPGSIKTMKQYAFTYDCVYEYIRTHYKS